MFAGVWMMAALWAVPQFPMPSIEDFKSDRYSWTVAARDAVQQQFHLSSTSLPNLPTLRNVSSAPDSGTVEHGGMRNNLWASPQTVTPAFANPPANDYRPPVPAARSTPVPVVPPVLGNEVVPGSVTSRTPTTFAASLSPAMPNGGALLNKNGKIGAAFIDQKPNADLVVFFYPGADGAALAREAGLTFTGPMNAGSPNTWILRAESAAAATRAQAVLSGLPGVQAAHQSYDNIRPVAMAFTPNDPFFFPGTNPAVGGPGNTSNLNFPGQWHLVNNMPNSSFNVNTISAGLAGAWANNFTGLGITIGIVDDAVEIGHADLAPNNATVMELNRFYNASGGITSNDPTPDLTVLPNTIGDAHGTSVAGVAASRGGNGIGGTGAAPLANLVGIRTNYQTFALVAAINESNGIALGTTIQVKNHSYGFTLSFVAGGLVLNTAVQNSAAAGTVNVYSAGNNRTSAPAAADVNKLAPQNSPFVLVVAALGSNGVFSDYSSFGANVFVTAPTNTTDGTRFAGVTTSDRTGSVGYNSAGTNNFASTAGGNTGLSYTNDFGGTSSSAPLVAGVVALTLQANPALLANTNNRTTLRAVKHLIARTSTVVNAADATATSDGGWKTNAAGFRTNQNYGFGLINATALTTQAPLFSEVTPLTTATTGSIFVGVALPDNNATGISRTFNINLASPTLQPLEEVVVTLNVTHEFRGDLRGFLTAPSGTRSRILNSTGSDGQANITNWQFTMVAFWGENPNGTWTINLADVAQLDTGTWNNYTVDFRMGTLVPVPEPTTLLAGGAFVLLVIRVRRTRVEKLPG